MVRWFYSGSLYDTYAGALWLITAPLHFEGRPGVVSYRGLVLP